MPSFFSPSFIKRYAAFFVMSFVFLFAAPHVVSAVVFETGLPSVPGAAANAPLPSVVRYVSYLYIFVLGVVGVAGFVSLVVWGTVWVATGIVDKKAMALESIKNTFIGIAIALSAYVILYTINPDLVQISAPSVATPGAPAAIPNSPFGTCTSLTPYCGTGTQCKIAAGETKGLCVPTSTFCTSITKIGECDAQSTVCHWCTPNYLNKDIGVCKNLTDACP